MTQGEFPTNQPSLAIVVVACKSNLIFHALPCRYISKENLRNLFGPEYPEEELDSIMKEARSENDKGISFADFVSQWHSGNAVWESQMTGSFGESSCSSMEKENSQIGSPNAGTNIREDGDDARALFLESKAQSVRKKTTVVARSKDEIGLWHNAVLM